jgi:hypothetical protein
MSKPVDAGMAAADTLCKVSDLFYVSKKKAVFLRVIIHLLQDELEKVEAILGREEK